jgi:hypothetical protein
MAGNANSGPKKEKPFRDALMMAIADAGEDRRALRVIASKLIAKAQEGDIQAIKEIADRMDGKVPQAVVGGDEDDNPMKVINEVIYRVIDPPKLNEPT